jgi:hypothetical protein
MGDVKTHTLLREGGAPRIPNISEEKSQGVNAPGLGNRAAFYLTCNRPMPYFESMEFDLGAYLKVLPQIATSPLAIFAFVCVLAASTWFFYRRGESENFLKALDKIPEAQRVDFSQRAGYKYNELAQLSPKDRLKRLLARDSLILRLTVIAALILLVITSIVAVHSYRNATKIENSGSNTGIIQNVMGNSNDVQTK